MAVTNRVAEVNRELKRLGFEERLRSCRTYYIFTGGRAEHWHQQSVMVYRASEMSVEDWIKEYYALRDHWRNR